MGGAMEVMGVGIEMGWQVRGWEGRAGRAAGAVVVKQFH